MANIQGVPFIKASLKQAMEVMQFAFAARIVPFLRSSPGLGKSSAGRQIADEYNLSFIDIRLAGMQPENMNGIPVVTYDANNYPQGKFVNFVDIFPTTKAAIPEGKSGWLINLDELPAASAEIQVAAYRVILDRELGNGEALHPNVYVMAAGNLITDNAMVEEMSTALVSRVMTIEVVYNPQETIDYFMSALYHPLVIGFLLAYPKEGHKFDPDSTDPFQCSRTWEMISKLCYVEGFDPTSAVGQIAMQGCIGSAGAAIFGSFCRIYNELPSFRSIVENPMGANVPNSLPTKFATMLVIVNNIPDDKDAQSLKDIENAVAYISRFPELEVKIALFHMIRNMKPGLLSNKSILSLGKLATKI